MSYLGILLISLIFVVSKNPGNNSKLATIGFGKLAEHHIYPAPTASGAYVLDGTLQSKPSPKLFNLRYGASALHTQNGTVMIGAGVSRTLSFKSLELSI